MLVYKGNTIILGAKYLVVGRLCLGGFYFYRCCCRNQPGLLGLLYCIAILIRSQLLKTYH